MSPGLSGSSLRSALKTIHKAMRNSMTELPLGTKRAELFVDELKGAKFVLSKKLGWRADRILGEVSNVAFA